MDLSQTDLADAVAISHEHTNRVLQTVFNERLVSLRRQKLTITDVRRLRDFARFDAG
ncbi:winged helix-turn-helix domain-containing protein [Methylorubrum populi]|nr:winged helix-turn-helix domain-containing protein [Methylorubrum rhodesianum]MBY0142925.1 winged helix-turn-helix domain-containing protein [Methylorubrum populi]